MKTNVFNQKIPEIKEILEDQTCQSYIRQTLIKVLGTLEVSKPEELVETVLQAAQACQEKESYEKQAHLLLEKAGVTKKLPIKLSGRADLIYSQIQPYLQGKTVLDLGCGDGKVGEKIAQQGLEVVLADVYKHQHIDETGLEFIQFKQGEQVPDGRKYDTTLLLTVLHHSEDPIKTLEEAKRLTKAGGYIILIESVYGLDEDSAFGRLTHEQQRLTDIFFDHFYNRVIHYTDDPTKKVSVPFHFRTPEQWKQIFEDHGMEQTKMVALGIDQPTVPEYHTLHVVKVK